MRELGLESVCADAVLLPALLAARFVSKVILGPFSVKKELRAAWSHGQHRHCNFQSCCAIHSTQYSRKKKGLKSVVVWLILHVALASLNDDATKLVFNDVKDLRTFAQRKKPLANFLLWVSLYFLSFIPRDFFLKSFFGLRLDGKSPTHPPASHTGWKTVQKDSFFNTMPVKKLTVYFYECWSQT